jgi:hypothetical protein
MHDELILLSKDTTLTVNHYIIQNVIIRLFTFKILFLIYAFILF